MNLFSCNVLGLVSKLYGNVQCISSHRLNAIVAY